jgi:hypothetical protein
MPGRITQFVVSRWIKRAYRRQFSLRTLLIGVTLAAMAIGLLCVRYQARARQVAELKNHGARISYVAPRGVFSLLRPLVTAVFGHEAADDVAEVQFGGLTIFDFVTGSPISDVHGESHDSDLLQLAAFSRLSRLNLSSSNFTNTGLKSLEKLIALKDLELQGSWVSDEAVQPLGRLQQLTTLRVRNSDLTNDGIQKLRESLPQCDVQIVAPEMIHLNSNQQHWPGDTTLVAPSKTELQQLEYHP